MTTAKSLDAPISFALKQEREDVGVQERDVKINENSVAGVIDDDPLDALPMEFPPISDSNFVTQENPDYEFLRLTTMIADIKSHTSRQKIHKNLAMFLEKPSVKVDAAVQTNVTMCDSNQTPDSTLDRTRDDRIQDILTEPYNPKISGKAQIETKCETLDERLALLTQSVKDSKTKTSTTRIVSIKPRKIKYDNTRKRAKIMQKNIPIDIKVQDVANTSKNSEVAFENIDCNTSSVQNENEDSQDSLLQHMEDMFCESDDSSDLMTLIEKHSGVTKANIDMEIVKMCPEAASTSTTNNNISCKDNTGEPSNLHANKRKLSYTNYKKMKKQAVGELVSSSEEGTGNEKKKRKASGIWFVERVHQVSKLKAKMMEISLTNYRKHGRIKARFAELFGESDEEDMMPDSPICIEEHLTSCKERIAPWVVKYLMPFYHKKRIADRPLFKVVAKHITDMLIFENTFPEQEDVNSYIQDYFKNKKMIKTKTDIYV
ncbi:uncharacterized protein LOC105699734 isoform X2 [Orussus abietinus]|uniref:uncharacterized protein LOC105699734 isoform X2 n=1 Tax=Orussus abietinus TaxID=222816 RepID=UPI00062669C2|nr:uncharacterized protein LOC105699734 isoform X2 [Orussus abietinus]